MKLADKSIGKTPERINDYIPVVTPSIWVFLATLLAFLGVVIIWGNVGRVPLKLTTTGVGYNYEHRLEIEDITYEQMISGDFDVDTNFCLLNPDGITSENIHKKPATVILKDGRQISGYAELTYTTPCTEKEIKETLKEYDLDTDWVYKGLDMGQYRYVVYVN
ncbi:hypothetical protein [Butyrivibrio sp. FC2001]|uniref:hypothetical protein n=1 Tax=Butyrivibrio sp. FC2001 TaxID=1280671 RepID=UPI0004202E76|nr:hypothetical protein [Butyrivibrio sp. FC2001]